MKMMIYYIWGGSGVASKYQDSDTRWEAVMVNNSGDGEAVEYCDASGEQHGIEVTDKVVPSVTVCSVGKLRME